MTFTAHSKWIKCLSLAEWWNNTSDHSAIDMSPFETLYGYPLGPLPLISSLDTPVASVFYIFQKRQAVT